MANLGKANIGNIYSYILNNSHLEDTVTARKSAKLGDISFVKIDARTQEMVLPIIEDMGDNTRDKARFMLDVSVINLLRKRDVIDGAEIISLDVHLGTLLKRSFRTRYLVVLADFVNSSDQKILLNITSIPASLNVTRLGDVLRYLIPIIDDVSLQVSSENILAQELAKISVKYLVLTIEELTHINQSDQRSLVLGRLSKLPDHNKEIIVRDVARRTVSKKTATQEEEAFYL